MEVLSNPRAFGLGALAALWMAGSAVSGTETAAGRKEPATGSSAVARQERADTRESVARLLERLEAAPEEELGPILVEAYDAFRAEAQELRLSRAESLALAMHARAHASWSALTLALLSTRMGRYERAEQVLLEQFERTEAGAQRVELLERCAIAAAGAGRRERSLDLLGRALVMGGRDAQQMLGRDALARGDYDRARRLFGALLPPTAEGRAPYEALEVPAWALRGWGLALLGPRADPVRPAPGRQAVR